MTLIKSKRNLEPVPRLPDGIFAIQKFYFAYILESLGKKNVGIF
jgi:hypothetical protein